MDYVWTCRCCGKQYNSLPFSYGVETPDPWNAVPETEREKRTDLTSDGCVIDEKEFYVRGCLEIPVIGCTDPFTWSIWVSLSKPSFERIAELWDIEIRDSEKPFFGWLCNDLPSYRQTFGLKTMVYLRNAGIRPFIQLEPTDHPLAIEQSNGISLRRVEEIASQVLQHS